MHSTFKHIAIATIVAATSLSAIAEVKKESQNGYSWLVSTNLQSILKSAEKGEGYKLEGQRVTLEGWLATVEPIRGNDGTPVFLLRMADTLSIDLPGLRKNSANPSDAKTFYCATDDRNKVIKLEKDKLVRFDAEIREVKSETYPTQYGNRTRYAVLARCSFP